MGNRGVRSDEDMGDENGEKTEERRGEESVKCEPYRNPSALYGGGENLVKVIYPRAHR